MMLHIYQNKTHPKCQDQFSLKGYMVMLSTEFHQLELISMNEKNLGLFLLFSPLEMQTSISLKLSFTSIRKVKEVLFVFPKMLQNKPTMTWCCLWHP